MAEVRIKCPLCGKILSADDKYLRYTVGCGKCHGTFVFDSICIEGNQGTIPVFPLANTDSQATEEIQNNSKRENEKDTSLDGVKVGVIAKAVFTYALQHRKCTEKELRELETSEKSKELFRFKYPLLMSFPKNNIQKESLVISGYCRYYKTPVIIDGIAYFICRQWWDYNRSTILRWAESHRITSDTIKAHIESSPNNTLPRLGSDTTKMPSDGRKKSLTESGRKKASFFKTLNKSIFVIGVTIPNDLRKAFLKKLSIKKIECGKSHAISIVLDGQKYDAKVLKANQKNKCYFWRIQWHKGSPIAKYLQNRFHNLYTSFIETRKTTVPNNCGIYVEATGVKDTFAIRCVGEDVSPQKQNNLLDEGRSPICVFKMSDKPQRLENTKPISISFSDATFVDSTWKSIYIQACKFFCNKFPDDFLLFVDENNAFKTTTSVCFSKDKTKLKSPRKLERDIWMETSFNTIAFVNLLSDLFLFFDYSLSDVLVKCLIDNKKKSDVKADETISSYSSSGDLSFDDLLEQWGKDNL